MSSIVNLLRLTSYVAYLSVALVFRKRSTSRSYLHTFRNRVMRKVCLLLSSKQLLQLYKPAPAVIKRVAADNGVQPREEDIPNGDGAKIYWVGNAKNDKLILYFHGGGYFLPVDHGHFNFLIACQKKLAQAGHDVTVAVLQYSLTPGSRFPTPPKQAMAALGHVLQLGYEPSNIVIGGDSAGGNLALAVLSLLNHPTDTISTLTVDEPLRGALLISPWVSFAVDAPSWEKNKDKDLLNSRIILEWGELYAPLDARDEYAEPLRADTDWWKNLPVDDVLNLAGGDEVFLDDIEETGKRLSDAGVSVTTLAIPNHYHEECIGDAAVGLAHGPMAEEIWKWLNARFAA